MARKPRAGGGWPAVMYTFSKAAEAGPWRLWKKMSSRNACKTCALGMGGQKGGMVNEAGHWPEVCKKSLQAQVADMVGSIDPEFFERKSISDLEKLTPKQAEDAGRLVFPVLLEEGGTHFRPVSWEAAIDIAASSLKKTTPDRTAFYSSGRSSNEAAFLFQLFSRIYGTNNVMNCSYYCHQASGVALKMTVGSGTATIDLDDLHKCDLIFLIGANPASNHPRLMTQLANLTARGGKIVVVNPLRERALEKFHVPSQWKSFLFGSQIATEYVQPLAGGDAAFLVGVLKALDEDNLIDKDFLRSNTENSEEVIADAKALTWAELEKHSGVSQAEMQRIAHIVAESKACIFAWAMGLTHHASGVTNILALCNVALATGNVGKPGAGLLPIRGHSNVQGIGSVGVSPSLQEGVRKTLEAAYSIKFPETPGLDTYATIEAASDGKLDTLFCLGGNLWGSNPNSDWAARSMQSVETIVYLSTKLNPGHFYGRGKRTLILPDLARDEESQATTQESMFNFVRLSEGGEANVKGNLRSEWQVIIEIADRLLGKTPVDWTSFSDLAVLRRVIAKAVPGWEEMSNIDQTKKEFTIGGRVFHKPSFPTSTGKAVMHRTPLPEFTGDSLRLVTLRSEGQFNTVVYEEYDLYRGVPHRFCIILSPEDARKRNLSDGQKVRVRGEAGVMENIEVVVGAIKEGVAAMYYPEANVLLKGNVDERSRTPAFKSAPITIET